MDITLPAPLAPDQQPEQLPEPGSDAKQTEEGPSQTTEPSTTSQSDNKRGLPTKNLPNKKPCIEEDVDYSVVDLGSLLNLPLLCEKSKSLVTKLLAFALQKDAHASEALAAQYSINSKRTAALADTKSAREDLRLPKFQTTAAVNLHQKIAALKGIATKANAQPPKHVHWSSKDSAPQVQFHDAHDAADHLEISVKGDSGFRMARANSAVEEGTFYYEVEILKGGGESIFTETVMASPVSPQTSPRADFKEMPHVRVGFANRTADLQAPVGYDRWSYAYRDKGGSKVNQSQRDDHWGGLPYKAGDTVGFLIHLAPRSLNSTSALTSANGKGCDGPPPNYIQFFHHGELCGEIIEKLGKKEGGVAYAITPGVYYPAVSCYSGGRVRANFGPTFVYPPNKDLVKDYKPFSEAAEKSASSSDLVQKLAKQVSLKFTVADKAKGRKKRMLNEEETDFGVCVGLLGEIIAARVGERKEVEYLEKQGRRVEALKRGEEN